MFCVDASKGTIYGLCLSQAAITLGAVLFFPLVRVQVYAPRILSFVNVTAYPSMYPATLSVSVLQMGVVVLVLSVIGMCFAASTMGHADSGNLGEQDYQRDTISALNAWNLSFWIYFAAAHLVMFSLATTPVDVHNLALACVLCTYFACVGCAPRMHEVSVTTENLNLLGYMIGLLLMGYGVPNGVISRLSLLFVTGALDYSLALGHTWDVQCTLETVANCRLFYVCAMSMVICVVYGMWHDSILPVS